jgi:tRNA nucleotidyltransferase/poly(A) polymerase
MDAFEPHVRNKKNAVSILKILHDHGFQANFAGGCVRDELLGVKPKDFDIATNALPGQVIACFKNTPKYKTIPTGIDHGTVTVTKSGFAYEVTTLREDVDTDGRHATVKFGQSFQQDALRRDLTINALFMDINGNLIDYVNGQKDLNNQILRFVGNADKRIKEDYLRILRFYRFKSRLNFNSDIDCMKAIAENTPMLKRLSNERVWIEIKLIFETLNNEIIFKDLINYDIIKTICQANLKNYHQSLAIFNSFSGQAHSLPFLGVLKFSIYLIENNISAEDVSNIFKLLKSSKKEHDLAIWIHSTVNIRTPLDNAMIFKRINILEKILSKETFTKHGITLLNVLSLDSNKLLNYSLFKHMELLELSKHSLRTSSPLLSGFELESQCQIKPGKLMGDIMKELRTLQLNETIKDKKDAVDWILKQTSTEP